MTVLAEIVLRTDQTEGSTHQVGRWLKRVGDPVRKDEPLLEVITDKVTVELASPVDGVLLEILKQEDEHFEIGTVLGRIGSASAAGQQSRTGELRAGPPPGRQNAPAADSTELSPAVRRLLAEHGLDAAQLRGTGRGGRITVQDVEAHLAGAGAPAGAPPAQAAAGRSRLVPHTPLRQSIAEHMARSVQTAPHVTAVFEADLSRVADHRREHKYTYTAYFVRATVAALRAVPEVNSRWHADGLELFTDCNVGVAVALESGGLIVPVLHRAQELDLPETAARLRELTDRAHAGKLEPRDVQGGTFTISNHGVSGSLLAAPIVIHQPQSAILGIGKVEPRPRASAAGAVEVRPMAYVTLTIDHRALDGFQANAFLTRWMEAIEQGRW